MFISIWLLPLEMMSADAHRIMSAYVLGYGACCLFIAESTVIHSTSIFGYIW